MHPYILQNLATERARDLRKRSAEMRRGRAARRGRAGTREGAARPGARDRLIGAPVHQ